jgi:hypothetical protein
MATITLMGGTGTGQGIQRTTINTNFTNINAELGTLETAVAERTTRGFGGFSTRSVVMRTVVGSGTEFTKISFTDGVSTMPCYGFTYSGNSLITCNKEGTYWVNLNIITASPSEYIILGLFKNDTLLDDGQIMQASPTSTEFATGTITTSVILSLSIGDTISIGITNGFPVGEDIKVGPYNLTICSVN